MKRRDLLRSSALTLGGALLAKALPAFADAPAPNPSVKRVLAMFKCHFDAGFIDTQANVLHRYFTEYFPHAIELTEKSRQPGNNRYVWTTGSWLLYEYLEQASPADRARMEHAIAQGDIAWHALPFSWQSEMLDPNMMSAGIAISKNLDRRFGRTTTGSKMTDVPGHTRGLISPIASQGVKLLHVGVNGGSTTPDVPPVFVWKDSRGASLITMYHHDYGGVTVIPGSDLAISINVRTDNSGPHPAEEVEDIYDDLRKQFPNARIIATNLSEIANAVSAYRDHLPVLTQEIGDTWIHGCSSDPLKVARYREVARLRLAWLKQGKFQSGDATDLALLRHVLAQWVPIPYLAQIDNVLEMAAPYLAKIQAAAPVVSSAIDQDGRPALDAIQTHGPELLDAIKQVFAIASNEDPARPADALPISAADVTHDQVAGYGVIIFTPGKTNAEQQREWDRASQT